MTIKEVTTTVTNWLLAREAGDRISKEVAAVRKEYIGQSAVEVMPNGNRVKCVIGDIDYQDSLVGESKWTVCVFYLEGDMAGYRSWTSDRVLEFGSK